MSSGAILSLISADGKQDALLTATRFLTTRLANIVAVRKSRGMDPIPTLADVERTHIVFTHAHYRPYAAVALEYQKQTATSATALGSEITFNIPQFGEFFSDMAVHVKLNAITHTGTGTTVNSPSFRYLDYVGERLMEKTTFSVNGNPIDETDYNTYVFHRQFRLPVSKRTAWNRCVGQEETNLATLSQAAGEQEGYQCKMIYTDGNQTRKSGTAQSHAVLEVMIPLLFWFNLDPRSAIPSVSIPHGQRFIKVTLAAISNVFVAQGRGTGAGALESTNQTALTAPTLATCSLYINNLFMNPEIHEIYIKRITFSLIRVYRRQTLTVNSATNSYQLSEVKWPVECMFVGFRPDVANYAWNSTFLGTSNTWHRFSQGTLNTRYLSSVAAGIQSDNDGASYVALTYPLTASASVSVPTDATLTTNGGTFSGDGSLITTVTGVTTDTGTVFVRALAAQVRAHTWSKTIDDLTIKAHGITLYNQFTSQFYNAYIPFTYGDAIVAPEDIGAMMVTFCLYPGAFQPSGHINVSRAREFYLEYNSSYFTASVTGKAYVECVCINFLLIHSGNASVRFST